MDARAEGKGPAQLLLVSLENKRLLDCLCCNRIRSCPYREMVLEQQEGGDVVGMSAGVSTPCQNILGLPFGPRGHIGSSLRTPTPIIPNLQQQNRPWPTISSTGCSEWTRCVPVLAWRGGWQLLASPAARLLFSVRPPRSPDRLTYLSSLATLSSPSPCSTCSPRTIRYLRTVSGPLRAPFHAVLRKLTVRRVISPSFALGLVQLPTTRSRRLTRRLSVPLRQLRTGHSWVVLVSDLLLLCILLTTGAQAPPRQEPRV